MKSLANWRRKAKAAPFEEFKSQFTLTGKTLGKGSFGEVREARHNQGGGIVAVKLIKKADLKGKGLNRMYKELGILKGLKHRNIITVHNGYEDSKTLYIVMPRVEGEELFTKLLPGSDKDRNILTEKDVSYIFRQIIEALRYCHNNGIVHRDVKPQNILIEDRAGDEERYKVTIIDFNLAFASDQNKTQDIEFDLIETQCGTPQYMAPEIYQKRRYNNKCDIWSAGVVLYFLLSGGNLPFSSTHTNRKEAIKDIKGKIVKAHWAFQPQEAWERISSEAKDLVTGCMTLQTGGRYDAEQILSSKWLKQETVSDQEIDTSPMLNFNEKVMMLATLKLKLVKALLMDEYNLQGGNEGL